MIIYDNELVIFCPKVFIANNDQRVYCLQPYALFILPGTSKKNTNGSSLLEISLAFHLMVRHLLGDLRTEIPSC